MLAGSHSAVTTCGMLVGEAAFHLGLQAIGNLRGTGRISWSSHGAQQSMLGLEPPTEGTNRDHEWVTHGDDFSEVIARAIAMWSQAHTHRNLSHMASRHGTSLSTGSQAPTQPLGWTRPALASCHHLAI